MTHKELFEFFLSGSIIYENVSRITVEHDTDMLALVGAVNAPNVTPGSYLVFYKPIEVKYEEYVNPDYTLHDEDGMAIYLLRIEEKNNTSSFFFYMWNKWSKAECMKAFVGEDWQHFWSKWLDICAEHGVYGAAERFYAQLSKKYRDMLVARACQVYDEDNEINDNENDNH